MSKYFDKLVKFSQWIVLAVMLVGYFAYMVLKPTTSIQQTLQDWQTWVHTAFVIYLNVTMVSVAYDTAVDNGTSTPEFELSNELNNKIIKLYNLKKAEFRKYIKALNEHELQSIRDEYTFLIGKDDYSLMTKKQRKKYDKLKAIFHDIYGFNLPLYYEMSKNGKIKYKASLAKNEGKKTRQFTKAVMGLVFSAMTINMTVSVENVGDAITSLLIIASGLIVTFLMIYTPQFMKFKKELPNKVMAKNVLMESFMEYEKCEVKLVELKEIKVEEVNNSVVDIADNRFDGIVDSDSPTTQDIQT